MSSSPLKCSELEALLDEILETEFTYRDTATPAASLATLGIADQRYVIEWVRRVSSTNIELGYQYASQAAQLLGQVDRELLEAWILHAMDTYDQHGLQLAKQVADGLEGFLHTRRAWTSGCVLEQSEGVLHGFLQGLSGRRLKLAEGEHAYTDSETLFLPPMIVLLEETKDNFLLYKATVAQLWAQTRFGTFRIFRSDFLNEIEGHPDPEGFLGLFHAIENLRLETRIERELPGLYREMQRMQEELAMLEIQSARQELQHIRAQLARPETDVHAAAELARKLHGTLPPVETPVWQGVFRPTEVAACMEARIQREKILLKVRLKDLIEETQTEDKNPLHKPFSTDKSKADNPEDQFDELERTEILLDGRPMPLPDDIKETLSSIMLDLGEIPDEYLEPAGAGEYDPKLFEDKETESAWSGTYHEEGAFIYPEWDYRRKAYRKNWCAVRELELIPVHDDFVPRTLEKYSGLVKHLRRTFEAMRDEDRRLKRQTDGDDVDLDALVEALADAADGREMSDRLFTRNHRSERNIAVVFMVDMSGSTKGWINEAERESLVLLCESLETLGDRYAIYGFSSITRKRCELYHIKHFDERYDEDVKSRIAAIEPKDYTRMGFAIRHLTHVLNEVDARTRILITLSDGKPDDFDTYRGDYGIEDTRRALIEARRDGVHPYCITIDNEARDYLSHLYGPAAWTLVDDVRSLPLKVSDIYRRLTV